MKNTIKIEKLSDVTSPDKKLEFSDLLYGKKVTAKIIGEGKYPKVKIVKFKAKKRYHKTQGHRQLFCEIEILNIA